MANFSPDSERNTVKMSGDYMEKVSAQAEIPSPGSEDSLKTPCNSARAEKGTRARASIVFSHPSKFSHGNLGFASGLKLSM